MRQSFGFHQGKLAGLVFFTVALAGCSSGKNPFPRSDGGGGTIGQVGTEGAGTSQNGTGSLPAAGGGGSATLDDGGGGGGRSGIGGRADAGGIASTGGISSKAADCGASATGGPNLQTDNNNCGACGNVCSIKPPSTAQCSGGRCIVTYVLGTQVIVTDFAVDTDAVYFATSELPGVMKVPLDGGAATPLEDTGIDAKRVAVYQSNVFWADSDTVYAWDPVMESTWTLSSGLCKPFNLLGNLTSAFWLTKANCLTSSPKTDGMLMTATRDALSPKVQVLASGGPAALALSATTAYWTVGDSVMKMPLAGGAPVVLASGQKTPRGIAVDATHVYWNSAGTSESGFPDGMVMKMPLGGGSPSVLASAQSKLADIAVDDTSVYWSTTYDGSNGSIMKLPVGSDTPVKLASGGINATRISVDATSVYWLSDFRVMKVTPK